MGVQRTADRSTTANFRVLAAVLAVISLVAVSFMSLATTASAGETTESVDFGPAQAPFADSADLAQCDEGANGTLLSVTIDAGAEVLVNYDLLSRTDADQTATIDADIVLTLDGPGLPTLTVDGSIEEDVALAGNAALAGEVNGSGSDTVTITDAVGLAPFIGTGTITYSVNAIGVVSTTFSSGNGLGGGTNLVEAAVLTLTCVFDDPANPSLSIDKVTNGVDGAQLVEGEAVTWTYTVTNTGDVDLTNVVVDDDKIGQICVIPSLPVGGTPEICTADGVAVAGDYMNVGTATADPVDGVVVSDTDPSNYTARALVPGISIDKVTNGVDGAQLIAGDAVTWTYTVTNTGETVLENVTVNDSVESMVCELTGVAVVGDYTNTGVATGVNPANPDAPVNADDPSNYTAVAPNGTRTIGYWKNHSRCDGRGNQAGVLDDILAMGGLDLSSTYTLTTCEDAIRLLNKQATDEQPRRGKGKNKEASDPVFNMTAQYVAASMNQANSTIGCPALADALADAAAVLDAVGFDSTGSYTDADPAVLAEANRLNGILDSYNNGGVCPGNFHG